MSDKDFDYDLAMMKKDNNGLTNYRYNRTDYATNIQVMLLQRVIKISQVSYL